MADSTWPLVDAVSETGDAPRHSWLIRITHWITTACFFALLVSGVEIVISHPRFYWGETGNVLTPSLFDLPIPASRSAVRTGYSFVLPDQNGWSRYLHFQAAWAAVLTGVVYLLHGLLAGHFKKNLMPRMDGSGWRAFCRSIADHSRWKRPEEAEAWSYNVLQRVAYLFVIFVLFPLAIWTGLAMSPAVVSAFPGLATLFGGQQSARTIHFCVSVLLVLFVLIHVVMVWRAGFNIRMRAMITGRAASRREA